jgi:hypothetical protein
MRCSVAVIAVIAGCGSDAEPLECSRADRTGTYLLQYTEQSGDCGPLPDAVGRLDAAEADAPGCTVNSSVWSEADCKLERTVTCESTADDLSLRMIGVTEQADSAGHKITGLMTLDARTIGGAYVCLSTYTMTAVRQ